MQIRMDQTVVKADAEVIFVTNENAHSTNKNLHDWQSKFGEVTIWRGSEPVLFVVGLGSAKKIESDHLRQAAGKVIRLIEKEKLGQVQVQLPNVLPADVEVQSIAEGFLLGTYKFNKYKSVKVSNPIEEVVILTKDALEDSLKKAKVYANATNLARDLANEPPNFLRPSVLAEFVQAHFENTAANVIVWDEDQLVKEQMMGLLAVGKGSVHKPQFIQIQLTTDSSLPLTALVGKGITFDTGGISLKSGRDISDMRFDMAGSAAVIGAMDALLNSGARCNVVGLISAAENIPDGGSMLPGELIQYRNGVSVQVANTDAEGRLVLADALIRSHELGAKYVVDIATLTGAAASALGDKYAAVFGSKEITEPLQDLSTQTGDFLWQMPLPDEYNKQLESTYADISNIGMGLGGAITAALFLEHFVNEDQVWAHIDMAGPMEAKKTDGYLPAGATGFGVRVLAEFASSIKS